MEDAFKLKTTYLYIGLDKVGDYVDIDITPAPAPAKVEVPNSPE